MTKKASHSTWARNHCDASAFNYKRCNCFVNFLFREDGKKIVKLHALVMLPNSVNFHYYRIKVKCVIYSRYQEVFSLKTLDKNYIMHPLRRLTIRFQIHNIVNIMIIVINS